MRDRGRGTDSMEYYIAAHTDIGIAKKINQDSLLYQIADTSGHGSVALCVVCDGMGGLAQGELASATLVRAFAKWFRTRLPLLLETNPVCDENLLRSEWGGLVLTESRRLSEYGARKKERLGTTVVAMLFLDGRYYIIHVGDSRAYELDGALRLLTKDQTYVQREMDLGHMTYEQAMSNPQRNVLLQCVGASEVLAPAFYSGEVKAGAAYMLCSDGFRNLIVPEEIYAALRPDRNMDERQMYGNIVALTERNKERNEQDNISVILVKAVE